MAKKQQKEEPSNLSETLSALEKKYGKGAVIGTGNQNNYEDVVSTGSIGLDWALGTGGLALGKIVEILGWESSGKSTLTLQILANAQAKGYKCLLVDGENSFDKKYAEALGVNVDELLIVQLDGEGGEKAYNVAESLIKSGEIRVVIFDSQNSLQPKKVLEDGVDSSNMGLHARMLGRVCVQLNLLADKYNCLCIFISQLREKIGVMFGSPETTQGGNALKFYAHVRLRTKKEVLKEGEEAYANKTTVKVIKNKLAPPFKEAEFNINYGEGIDVVEEIIDLGTSTGLIKKWGKQITIVDNLAGRETKLTREEFEEACKDRDFLFSMKRDIIEKLDSKETKIEEEEE